MSQTKIVLLFTLFFQIFLSSSVVAQPVTDFDSRELVTTTREFSSSKNEYLFQDNSETQRYIQFLQSVNENQIEAVAKILRGQSAAQANCVHLAKAMIQFFKTGKVPTETASEEDCHLGDYTVELVTGPSSIPTKQEISESSSSKSRKRARSVNWITHSTIQNPGSFEEDMPPDILPMNVLDGESFIQESIIDFTQYSQFKIEYSKLTEKLKELAVQEGPVQVSFGKINLGRIVRNQQIKLGHMLVYFASHKQVWYIDLQKINRGVGKAVYHSIEEIVTFYSESGKRQLKADLFGPTVFYVPLGPKLNAQIRPQKKVKIEPFDKKDDHSKISSASSVVMLPSEVSSEISTDTEGPSRGNQEMANPSHSGRPMPELLGPGNRVQSADQRLAQAQFYLGFLSRPGGGAPLNDQEAARLFKLAGHQGFSAAQYYVKFIYEAARRATQNDQEATSLFKLAVDQGFKLARYYLGSFAAKWEWVSQGDQGAARLHRLAADEGLAKVQFYLGFPPETGRVVSQEDQKAANFYRLAADQGLAEAQFNLGFLYKTGIEVPQNDQEAAKLLRIEVGKGLAEAQFNLGYLYETGRGVKKDDQKAAELYHLAAKQGLARARCNLGYLYETGKGVPKDDQEAAKFYHLAAKQGLARAQCNLGYLYETGRGVKKDDQKAAELYQSAADQGMARAQCHLGFLYRTGRGVPKDDQKAAMLFQLAADQWMAQAQCGLGLLL